MISDILNLVKNHEEWRVKQCINLIPSENVTSPQVRSLLSSELVHRYTAPDHFYMGSHFIDEVEKYGERIAKDLFNSKSADLRPLSGHIADLIFLGSFTSHGDVLMCVSEEDGGYPGIWKEGLPRILGVNVEAFPFSKERMNLLVEESVEKITRIKPQVVIFGSSLFMFPHPVRIVAKAAKAVGAHVGFDASHVMGLIAGGKFQRPLQEGASTIFGSTHKTFFGPQGGIILSDDKYGEAMKSKINPAFVDNAHWNRIAALTLALAEAKKFGRAYAEQVIRNAQFLAKALDDYGFPVVGADFGYTTSHQVFLNYGGYKMRARAGRKMAERLEKANIIVDCGVRLGTCEVTRLGMKEAEMQQIAELIKDAATTNRSPAETRRAVERLKREFQDVKYCFP